MRRLIQHVKTNEQGEFEVYSSAYKHTVVLQGVRNLYETFDLANEAEKEIHFHYERPPTIPIRGVVRFKDTGVAVSGATISFGYEDQKANDAWTETKSASDGVFTVERAPYQAKAFAISADGKFADLRTVSEGDSEVNFELRPTATVRGRAINSETGEPLVDKYVTYGVRVTVPHEDGSVLYSLRFGNRVLTDKEGRFITGPLATEIACELSIEVDESGHTPSLAKLTPAKDGVIDLGDLEVAPPKGR